MMKKSLSIALAVLASSVVLGYAVPTYAAPVLKEVKNVEVAKEDTVNKPMTMKERLAARQAVSKNEEKVTVSGVIEGHAYVPKGTGLTVETTSELNSKTNKQGSPIMFKLVDGLIINDVVVIPSGTNVIGHVTVQKKAGGFGRAGKLEFSVDSVKTVNNVVVPLEYTGRIEAGSDGGAVAVATAVSLVGGLFMKGANVSIPAGTQIPVKVKSDTDLQVALTDLAEAMNPDKPHGVSVTIK